MCGGGTPRANTRDMGNERKINQCPAASLSCELAPASSPRVGNGDPGLGYFLGIKDPDLFFLEPGYDDMGQPTAHSWLRRVLEMQVRQRCGFRRLCYSRILFFLVDFFRIWRIPFFRHVSLSLNGIIKMVGARRRENVLSRRWDRIINRSSFFLGRVSFFPFFIRKRGEAAPKKTCTFDSCVERERDLDE